MFRWSPVGDLYDLVHRWLPPPLREFVKFGVVGTIGFIIDFSTYGILTRLARWDTVYCLSLSGSMETIHLGSIRDCTAPHVAVVAANMVSVLLAVTSNFYLNKFWTFRHPEGEIAVQGAAYFALSVVAWTLNQLLTGFFASQLAVLHQLFGGGADMAAKILAIGVILFLNFGVSKFLIFRRAESSA